MPIYAYKCESCGFAKDVLQKISDAPLEVCPTCSLATFRKQITAAGFQLKGSGWYVTDFRGGANTGGTGANSAGAEPAKADTVADTPAPATSVSPSTTTTTSSDS